MGSQAAVVLLLTLVASALGFVRELATAAVYATTVEADAFALTQVYVEGVATFMTYGVASQVLVPLLVRLEAVGDRLDRELISGLFAWILWGGAPLAVLVWWQTDAVVAVVAPLASQEHRDALRPLVALAVPTFMLISGAGVASGALRARADFYTPVVGRALFSLAPAIGILAFGAAWGTRAAAAGLVVGAGAQFGIQIWRLRALGWNWVRPRLAHTRLGDVIVAAWPVLAALFLTQLLVFGVQRALTSDSPTGDFATTNYAQRLLSLVTLLSLSVSTVAATDLARRFQEGGLTALVDRVVSHLEALSFILAPATVLLMALSRLLVELAFHRGGFTDAAALQTAMVLRVWAWALLPGGVCMILQLLFTSAHRPHLVLAVSVPMVCVVWLLSVLLKSTLGPTLLAVSSVGGTLAMLGASLFVTARLVGPRAVVAYGGYVARLALRLLVAMAVASLTVLPWLGPEGAARWVLADANTVRTLVCATIFVTAFGFLSHIARDPGWQRVIGIVSPFLPRRH